MNPVHIETDLRLVLLQWLIIIVVAWVFGRLTHRLHQPLAVGEMAAGLVLGPSLLGALAPDLFAAIFPASTSHYLQFLGKFGLILLLFQVGMEFDHSHLRVHSRTVAATAVTGVLAPALLGWIVGPWLHRNFAPETNYVGFQLFVCIALSITALPMLGRMLLEMKLERSAVGVLSIGAAAIDDVVGWIGLALVTTLARAQLVGGESFRWLSLVEQAGGVVLLFLVLMYGLGPAMRRFWRWCVRHEDDPGLPPTFLAALLVVLFTCCIITNLLGVFSLFGAFLLGASLHRERGLVEAWRRRFQDFVLVAFVPLFFTNTGLRTDIGALDGGLAWLGAAVVFSAAVLGKLGGCYLGARLTGQDGRTALSIAALMNTRALMGLVAIHVGADLGLLPPELFTMFVIMALATTAMTGPLLRIALPPGARAG